MLKVKLHESYPNKFWNSGVGITISKGEEVSVDENNPIIYHALQTNILEVAEKDDLQIINDIPTKDTIKEVVSDSNTKHLKSTFNKMKEGKKNAD